MSELATKRCKPCEGGVAPYNAQQVRELLKQLKGWIIESGRSGLSSAIIASRA